MRAVRFTARAPLFRVISDLEFRAGQWTAVQIDELSQEQLDGMVTYHGTHLGIHPDDGEALAEHGLAVDGRNKLVRIVEVAGEVGEAGEAEGEGHDLPVDTGDGGLREDPGEGGEDLDDEDGTPPLTLTPVAPAGRKPAKGGRKRG
jgi:hypothetical protein